MITLRKLEGLAEFTRLRKVLTLLSQPHEPAYLTGLVRMTTEFLGQPEASRLPQGRELGLLRQRLAQKLGIDVADWDLQTLQDGPSPLVRWPYCVWLDDLRAPFNVGSIIRTAEAYGFTSVHHSLDTPGADHPRTVRSAMGTTSIISVTGSSLSDFKSRWGTRPVFALELGGTAVDEFSFPEEGCVLVGGEELGLSPEALSWADQSWGRVSLPLYGQKTSLNVGVAFGILAEAWTRAKKSRP